MGTDRGRNSCLTSSGARARPRSPPLELMRVNLPDSDIPMSGWLLKRHAHDRRAGPFSKQWAKRFVTLNTHRGTLAVSKGERGKPTTIMPLCDISLIKEIEGSNIDWCDGCFQISCPPLQLILRAQDREERETWIRALREHAAEWQSAARLEEKAAKSGVPFAIASQYAPVEIPMIA